MEASKENGLETLLTPEEAAAALGIRRRTLEEWVRAGKVPVVRMGRLNKFRPTSLQRFIEAQEQQAVSAEK